MDFKLTDEQKALKKEFDDFFREEMKQAPKRASGGAEGQYTSEEGFAFHRYMMKQIADRGWNVMAWPKKYGGREALVIEQILFSESQAYHQAPGIDGFGVKMFAPTVMLFATEEQKERILPPIAKAEVHYCQGWSEPNAGSDLASLTTMAIREGDYYTINGQKIWTTGAHRADHMFMLARTDPDSKRSRGLSVFNIDMSTPGIEIRPIKYMNGSHIVNEVFFTDVKVPIDERVGPENDGWKLTRATMNFERSSAGVYAGLKRTFEDLMEYAKTHKRDGKPLVEHPAIRRKLAGMWMDIEIGRALAYKIAYLQEGGNLLFSPAAASESKVFSSELRQRVVSQATEILGLYGQLEPSKWAPLNGSMVEGYQVSIGSTICAGSNEIQRNIIAWVGLELPRFN
jgi:alkylation response protein AidB-like acyl-CoA dehydrogenase